MEAPTNCLFITFVEKEGPFLKVWGQTDKNTSLYVEQVLHSFTNQFDNGLCIPHLETLQIGILCCAKYKDSKYYRARITSLDFLHNRYIEVNFVDYGHKDIVPVTNIRSLEGFETSFISIQPQANSFLLAEAVCPRGEWNDAYLDEICKEIRYSEVNFSIVAQVTKHYLVRLFVGVNDLAIILISKGLMRHTSLTTQEAVLLSMMPRTPLQQQPAAQQNIVTFKAFTLEPGHQYQVYVSYVTDGPCNFSVQLKQSEEVLAKLMKEINSMTLAPIEGIPLPGTVCLARCMEDAHICRAVVTNEVDGQYKVFYVDFGNFEVLPLESLYEIPFKFVIPKVMAIRFALAGVEKSTVTLEMQCAFKQFVDNRLIHMNVMPMTARTSLPRCELWDPETKISAMDIVNQAASAGYPEHISLNRGFSQLVKVSYVFSCNRFYVQLKARQDELLKLMLDIQNLCRDSDVLSSNKIKKTQPCYALYEGDQQWYRSQIVEVLSGGIVKVQYVDYGNEENVTATLLKPIEGRQLTILRPQAIECCLNGYQNMEPDVERDNLLEELILEQEFTMKVVEMQGKKALIELIDDANYNVASLLLEKIAATRSQVSPMLVQAGNKIEHRKTSQPYLSKEQRKPERQWSESSNENSGWRHDNRGSRNRSYDGSENNENNSWRQNNKGFNKNYDRSKRDNDLNDSTDSEKHSTKNFGKNEKNRNDFNSRSSEGNWKQNNRGFNKTQDRYNRDSNRNSDWANSVDESKSPKNQDDWGNKRENTRQNYNSRTNDDWSGSKDNEWNNTNSNSKDGWNSPKENDNKHFNKRDQQDGWGGGRKNFNSGKNDDWGGSADNDSKPFNRRDKDTWGNKEGESESKSFNRRDKDSWGNKDNGSESRPFKRRDNDNWGNRENDGESRSFNKRDNWSNRENDKRNFNAKSNDWQGSENKQEDSWGNQDGRKGRDNFKSNRNRSDEGNNEWNNTESTHKGGFHKKPDFRRETSELSNSSGSEKSFRKGFKDNFRNKPNFNKKFDKPKSFGDDGSGDAWNVSTSTVIEVPNPAPDTAKFTSLNVDGTESTVIISWFHNPAYFYCQIQNTQEEFKRMMEDIQKAYKGRPSTSAVVGAPVIGLFPEDKVLYRAEVREIIGSQYKIYYVDFGNVSVIDKVWPIELRFMELPAQAACCKLLDIEPPAENWPDASSYSPYFDKREFLCRFILTENDKTSVQLEADNEDIASSLLRDGLAIASQPLVPPELPLLIGQQFRAMLISVNSLADFAIALQSGFVLNCSIFNLSVSTETWEDNLKEKIDQKLIVYVDDLKDDRLEVTLYDQDGQKIKLIDRDEEAYETVDLLCPYLIMYSSLSGEISHVKENTVYLQPADSAALLEYLLNSAFEYYESLQVEEPIQPVEGFLYSVKGSDTNWYRGKVVKIDDNQVTVDYVDYGNDEQVEFSALRELTAEYMEVPISCLPVAIADATEELIGKAVVINLTFTENGLEGTIQEEQIPVVAVEETQYVPEPEQIEVAQIPIENVAVAPCGNQVIMSHADSPSDFYLQFAESIDAIDELQATLQNEVSEMADIENPVTGVLCAAPYSLDQQWYRAQVLDADADITTVRFVDYGNTDVLDNNSTRVKTLPPNLLALEVHATRCRLKIKPIDEEWTSTASERFNELCKVDTITAQFISQDEKTNYVELFCDGVNVREVLIQENLALPDEEVLAEASSVGFVSHLNSPSEFWIQLENCVAELEWVAEQLSGAESFSELEDLAPGALCAALFPDDLMWYRARILSNTVAGIEVLFVDYGNSCTSCSLRELPEDLVMLPPLAQKCSLQKPENLTNWGPGMIKKFSEISAEGQTTFNVKKLSTGETASVELLLDGVDLTTLLLPNTENVRVKSFEGLHEMVLVRENEELPAKYKLECLPDVTWGEESLNKFAEINDSGNTVFQAEFVSDDTVRLYLGLNDIRLDLNGIKITTPTSSPMKVRSEISSHSEIATGDDEIKIMVEGLLENAINRNENKAFAEKLIAGVVASITNSFQSVDIHAHAEDQDHLHHINDITNHDCVSIPSPTKIELTESEDFVDDSEEMKHMLEGVVQSAIDDYESNAFVEGLITDVVTDVDINSPECIEEDITNNTAVITDDICSSTNAESCVANDIIDAVVDNTEYIEESSTQAEIHDTLQDSVVDSTNSTSDLTTVSVGAQDENVNVPLVLESSGALSFGEEKQGGIDEHETELPEQVNVETEKKDDESIAADQQQSNTDESELSEQKAEPVNIETEKKDGKPIAEDHQQSNTGETELSEQKAEPANIETEKKDDEPNVSADQKQPNTEEMELSEQKAEAVNIETEKKDDKRIAEDQQQSNIDETELSEQKAEPVNIEMEKKDDEPNVSADQKQQNTEETELFVQKAEPVNIETEKKHDKPIAEDQQQPNTEAVIISSDSKQENANESDINDPIEESQYSEPKLDETKTQDVSSSDSKVDDVKANITDPIKESQESTSVVVTKSDLPDDADKCKLNAENAQIPQNDQDVTSAEREKNTRIKEVDPVEDPHCKSEEKKD